MPRLATVLEVLIASPGDVAAARDLIEDTLHDWNAAHSRTSGVVLQPIRWETHARPEMGDRPQAIINRQIVDSADLLIGVFWTRLGTDTGVASSGTAEEIGRFVASGKPVALYVSEEPAQLDKIDLDQYQRLKLFRAGIEKSGLLATYSSAADLRVKLARHVAQTVNALIAEGKIPGAREHAQASSVAPSFEEKCLAFRDMRVGGRGKDGKNALGDIYTDKTPAKIPLSSLFIAIHAFPANAFDSGTRYDLTLLEQDQSTLDALNAWEPPKNWRGSWSLKRRFNPDGLLLFHDKMDYCTQYIQFRNDGIVEAVDHGLMRDVLHSKVIPGPEFERGLSRIVPAILCALRRLNARLPILMVVSLRGPFEYSRVSYPSAPSSDERMGLKDELLLLPPVVASSFENDAVTVLRPWFDALARAGGFSGSPTYAAPA
jgi:nucleoside 2-deoxyribosyltransferase